MSTSTLAVEASGLIKRFGDMTAVGGVDLEIKPGEVFGVLGPNGAGKTTTLAMLATLLPIDGGWAKIYGVDVASEPHKIRQLVGVTGQYASVDENLTGYENLWLFAKLHGRSSRQARSLADDLLGRFGLTESAAKQIKAYSGGMRRRLDLAASLISAPPLIFLDEPTTGLDPRTRGQMWDTIRELVSTGATILLTTQYLDEADQLADRIAVIDQGLKVAEGRPDELKASVGDSTLNLRVVDPLQLSAAADVVRIASGREPSLSPEAGALGVPLADANLAAEVLVQLRGQGIAIASISVEQPTLDEVFFALTGRDTSHDQDANSLEDAEEAR